MYPIIINKRRECIRFDEIVELDGNSLTIADLHFVGKDSFSIHEREYGGYTVSVSRSRYETNQERDDRIARGEAYMAEYRKRHPATPSA